MVSMPLSFAKEDFWYNEAPDLVDVTCLMPYGIVINVQCFANATIREVKEDVWEIARTYPLFDFLREKSMYVIKIISTFATLDELTNESKRLCDIQPYFCLLQIVEKQQAVQISTDYEIVKDIGCLIGKCVDDFRALKNLEINDFRYKMQLLAGKIASERLKMTPSEKLMYQYPPRLAKSHLIPGSIKDHLKNENFVIVVKFDNDDSIFTFCTSFHITPQKFIDTVLSKMTRNKINRGERVSDYILKVRGRDEYLYGDYSLGQFSYIRVLIALHFYAQGSYQESVGGNHLLGLSQSSVSRFIKNVTRLIVLHLMDDVIKFPHNTLSQAHVREGFHTKFNMASIIGAIDGCHVAIISPPEFDERLRGNLYRNRKGFFSINVLVETLSRNDVPVVIMRLTQNIDVLSPNTGEAVEHTQNYIDVNLKSKPNTLRKKSKTFASWSIQDNFQVTLESVEKINCDISKTVEVGVNLGLFHGGRLLCSKLKSKEVLISNTNSVKFNELFIFDVSVQNIPRMARLCLVIYEINKSTKLSGSRGKRCKDNKDLYMNPLAWVNTTLFDYKHQLKCGSITLFTWTYADDIQSDKLFQPLGTVESNPRIDECAAIKLSFHNYDCHGPITYPTEEVILQHADIVAKTKSLNRDSAQDPRPISIILAPYLSNDRICEMYDQERNVIWSKRHDCLNDAPEGLPLLLHCVEWNNRDEVAEINTLLKKWPALSVPRSLELLDFAYADPIVRTFAVKCLKELRDDELLLYLLQLVQAIKHESYLDCELVEFLLDRALRNQRIGHYFFWHLRSEMQVPSVQTRFGLILEAYLKGSSSHVPLLLKQMECLEKLKQGSEAAKKGNKEKVRSLLQDFLTKERNSGAFRNVSSPLDPYFRYKTVRPEKCKVMDSKMRPLWIVFENADMHGEDIYIIFKNGDDLRQDMLTLQMLRVMDQIWKNKGYDFRLNIYGCISMERKLGMIEVVLNAETIANIQKEKGMFSATSPFRKGSLLSWLREHNTTEETLKKAIKEFTLSCAGYCVATYVLGVADRHSDNIMVKTTGQLFHIDFGHILGHFKEKFGVRRERVPFVLTHDFVYVINNGRTDKEAVEFQQFQDLCEEAFLILRQHGCLILSLFAMMISTGLPELSSEKDLNYLRETLVLDLSEEKAREHFKSKFSEALANSWKTSLNWASHNFSKNNKQ